MKAAEAYGSKLLYDYRNCNAIAVSIPAGKTTEEAIRYYLFQPGVLSTTPDQLLPLN